ncbi:MAG: hypothetical protein HDT37_09865 [Clostridiales bacterium]|nr:hypothetical protein [Clostridiales bacterium]
MPSIKNSECPFCNTLVLFKMNEAKDSAYFFCPICGCFEYALDDSRKAVNCNHIAAYLIYNKGSYPTDYNSVANEQNWDEKVVHIDYETVENWYPKTLPEKVDAILLYIYKCTKHIGQTIKFSKSELFSFLFLDRCENPNLSTKFRAEEELRDEGEYILKYLAKQGYIEDQLTFLHGEWQHLRLTPQGYAKVDEIQRNTANGKNVFVAMKFGNDTKLLREAIRMGITSAGYIAIFIDEVQHNDFITPELLKYIKDSKFVVVDLTHQNNGAYFEEGYAMGLGKPVIQLCQDGIKLHFDIAQKNTIMWKTEADIPPLLCNRIKATID